MLLRCFCYSDVSYSDPPLYWKCGCLGLPGLTNEQKASCDSFSYSLLISSAKCEELTQGTIIGRRKTKQLGETNVLSSTKYPNCWKKIIFRIKDRTCLVPILKETKQPLMAADLPHLLSVDKIKHKYEKTVKELQEKWQEMEMKTEFG